MKTEEYHVIQPNMPKVKQKEYRVTQQKNQSKKHTMLKTEEYHVIQQNIPKKLSNQKSSKKNIVLPNQINQSKNILC